MRVRQQLIGPKPRVHGILPHILNLLQFHCGSISISNKYQRLIDIPKFHHNLLKHDEHKGGFSLIKIQFSRFKHPKDTGFEEIALKDLEIPEMKLKPVRAPSDGCLSREGYGLEGSDFAEAVLGV
jgi:hypothetical protein